MARPGAAGTLIGQTPHFPGPCHAFASIHTGTRFDGTTHEFDTNMVDVAGTGQDDCRLARRAVAPEKAGTRAYMDIWHREPGHRSSPSALPTFLSARFSLLGKGKLGLIQLPVQPALL